MPEPAPFELLSINPRRAADAGRAELGGKAHGLLSMQQVVAGAGMGGVTVSIPPMTVIGTSVFDAFMQRGGLWELALSDAPDERIAQAFLRADMPFEALGRLHNLAARWTFPLAVRSSGMLEDTTSHPFAGVYQTKMIPNNPTDPAARFQKLVEAVKLVWASTFFKLAKDYCQATELCMGDERMAVIVQAVVGKRYHDRFYPELSGVARSYNYYPVKPAGPRDGVANLALGLGKTIVDGGKSWIYSPAYPQAPPPYASPREMLEQTQTEFWALHMGQQNEYHPTRETEYLRREPLSAAERDGSLRRLASTFDLESERLSMGTGARGPRVLNFAPLLSLGEIPFNPTLRELLSRCEQAAGSPVEIEFAMTFDPHRLGFLQVRPMRAPAGDMQVTPGELAHPRAVVASESALGNGQIDGIRRAVYVIPERFDLRRTRQVAAELAAHNARLLAEQQPYLLIVFGRLGTLDPWLGIPVTWGQVCGAKVIVEASRADLRVEMSQGSHYFHNITNLGVLYFSVPVGGAGRIDWDWFARQAVLAEGDFTRLVQFDAPLRVKVDGRSGRGVMISTQIPANSA